MATDNTAGGYNVSGGTISFNQSVQDSGSSSSSSQSSSDVYPEWYKAYVQDLISRGKEVSNTPYQAYTGDTVADLNPDQLGAMQMIRDAAENPAYQQYVDQWAPAMAGVPGALGQASEMIKSGATFDPEQYNMMYNTIYADPVRKMQAEAQRVGQQDFRNTTLSDLTNKFTGTGQFGSSRNQILGAQAAAMAQAEIEGKSAGVEMQGRGSASQDYLNWAKQGTASGQALAGVAGQTMQGAADAFKYGQGIQNAIGQDASALAGVGQQLQQYDQTNLDDAYKRFQEAQAFPWAQVEKYRDTMKNVVVPHDQHSSSSSSSSNWSTGDSYGVGLTLPSETNMTGTQAGQFLQGMTGGMTLTKPG